MKVPPFLINIKPCLKQGKDYFAKISEIRFFIPEKYINILILHRKL